MASNNRNVLSHRLTLSPRRGASAWHPWDPPSIAANGLGASGICTRGPPVPASSLERLRPYSRHVTSLLIGLSAYVATRSLTDGVASVGVWPARSAVLRRTGRGPRSRTGSGSGRGGSGSAAPPAPGAAPRGHPRALRAPLTQALPRRGAWGASPGPPPRALLRGAGSVPPARPPVSGPP